MNKFKANGFLFQKECFTRRTVTPIIHGIGGMAEWSKAPVLKTGNR